MLTVSRKNTVYIPLKGLIYDLRGVVNYDNLNKTCKITPLIERKYMKLYLNGKELVRFNKLDDVDLNEDILYPLKDLLSELPDIKYEQTYRQAVDPSGKVRYYQGLTITYKQSEYKWEVSEAVESKKDIFTLEKSSYNIPFFIAILDANGARSISNMLVYNNNINNKKYELKIHVSDFIKLLGGTVNFDKDNMIITAELK
jgi:hypothetical protein